MRARHAADDVHALAHPVAVGQLAQPDGLVVAVAATGDHQVGAGEPAHRPQHGVHALARHHPADAEHERPFRTRRHRPLRAERLQVHPARHYRDPVLGDARRAQLAHLVPARGQHGVGAQADLALRLDPVRRARVGLALPAALDRAERVERLHHRDPAARRPQCRLAAHPEVRVRHVRRPGGPAPGQPLGELRHVRGQLVLGDGHRGARRDVLDRDARGRAHRARLGRGRAPGVDDDRVPPIRQGQRQPGDVHVLAAGVHAADRRQRVRVL